MFQSISAWLASPNYVILNAKSGMKVEEAANHTDPDADVIIIQVGSNDLRDLTSEKLQNRL